MELDQKKRRSMEASKKFFDESMTYQNSHKEEIELKISPPKINFETQITEEPAVPLTKEEEKALIKKKKISEHLERKKKKQINQKSKENVK
jgi:hypothetical protein